MRGNTFYTNSVSQKFWFLKKGITQTSTKLKIASTYNFYAPVNILPPPPPPQRMYQEKPQELDNSENFVPINSLTLSSYFVSKILWMAF